MGLFSFCSVQGSCFPKAAEQRKKRKLQEHGTKQLLGESSCKQLILPHLVCMHPPSNCILCDCRMCVDWGTDLDSFLLFIRYVLKTSKSVQHQVKLTYALFCKCAYCTSAVQKQNTFLNAN